MDPFHVTFVVLFLAWAVVRIDYRLKARTGGKEEKRAEPLTTLAKIFVGFPAMLAVLVYMFRPQLMNWSSVPLRPAWRWMGAAILAVGVAGLTWVHWVLGKNFSSELRIRSDQTLVTSSPYRYVRHPMYSASFLLFLGMGLLAANWFIGAAGLLAYFLIVLSRVSQEEKMMANIFGDQYRRYASTTGRFLPRVRATGPRMIS